MVSCQWCKVEVNSARWRSVIVRSAQRRSTGGQPGHIGSRRRSAVVSGGQRGSAEVNDDIQRVRRRIRELKSRVIKTRPRFEGITGRTRIHNNNCTTFGGGPQIHEAFPVRFDTPRFRSIHTSGNVSRG